MEASLMAASNGLHGMYLRLKIVSEVLRVNTDTTS